jgi:hypothetical protein
MNCAIWKGAVQTQKETVVGIVGVINAVLVSQQRPEDGTEFEEMIPVLGRTRQATDFQAQDDADVVQGDLGEQPLKAGTVFNSPATRPLVVVDDLDALAWPAERGGVISEGILTLSGFLMVEDLLRAGLANVDDSEFASMLIGDRCQAAAEGGCAEIRCGSFGSQTPRLFMLAHASPPEEAGPS